MRMNWVNSPRELVVDLHCYQGGILTVGSTGDETKTLDPGLRRDDAGNSVVATTTNVVPAQAGTQCLYSYACGTN